MTDQDIICTFMEPKPVSRPGVHGANELWWRWGWHHVGPSLPQRETPVEYCWLPRKLTLDALWEVEERLTAEQWDEYLSAIVDEIIDSGRPYSDRNLTHATPEQKIKALAAVLRPIVEGKACL